jgi:hypothetical protein
MSEFAKDIDWSLTTWEGSRRAQLRRALGLTLRERLEAAEALADVARRFADLRAEGALRSPTDAGTAADDAAALIERLVANEDRAPRSLIDECVRRGKEMIDRLTHLAEHEDFWNRNPLLGEWWMRLHAAMIFGLIPGERSGLALVGLLRRAALAEDENLQGWLAGYWPALFHNKPDAVEPSLRALAQDRSIGWYTRIQALESVIAFAERRGAEALDAALDWAAAIAADEAEDWELRLCAGNDLLDFPRGRHRSLLEDLAARQSGWGVHFSMQDVRNAFSANRDTPHWRGRFEDPWSFYTSAEIAQRQARWAKERAPEQDKHDGVRATSAARQPVHKPGPKIGRNEPCPCGSGKKYKKCCLGPGRKFRR